MAMNKSIIIVGDKEFVTKIVKCDYLRARYNILYEIEGSSACNSRFYKCCMRHCDFLC
jgi:hypothetical protein